MVHVGARLINEDGRIVPHVTLRTEGKVLIPVSQLAALLSKISEWGDAAQLMGAEVQMGTLLGELVVSDAEGEA